MIDLVSLIKASQVNWVHKYLSNEPGMWRNTMEECINVENLNILLRSDFSVTKVEYCCEFYHEALKCWKEIKWIPSNMSETYIHYNKDILIGGKMFYNKNFLDAGIWSITDLLTENKTLIPAEQLANRGLTAKDILDLFSIVHALPRKWKNKLWRIIPLSTTLVLYLEINGLI